MDFKKTLHRRRFEQKLVETQPVALSPEALEARESLLLRRPKRHPPGDYTPQHRLGESPANRRR